jgi:hypothetical protein
MFNAPLMSSFDLESLEQDLSLQESQQDGLLSSFPGFLLLAKVLQFT